MKKFIYLAVLSSFSLAHASEPEKSVQSKLQEQVQTEHKAAEHINSAHANIINNQGKLVGRATFKQGSEGLVISIKASDLPPGIHGMHFHETGDCTDHEHFEKAKGHILTHEKLHGYLNENGPHEADLPNLIVHEDGTVHVEQYTDMVSLTGLGWKPELLDNDGSSLIIHQDADDYVSQPTGNSGERIACGSILAGIPGSYK